MAANPTKILESHDMADLAAAREAYLAGDRAPEWVRPGVLRSWARSRAYGVDPYLLEAQQVDDDRLRRTRERNRPLIQAAEPFLSLVHETLADQPHLVVVSDREGVILRARIGPGLEPDTLERANLMEGASWHERDIGCNGVGTCLAEGEPVILIGPEHFQESYVGWTCIGVPIHGPSGDIVGALDLSVPNEHSHVHAWGWTLSVARGIETSLARGTLAFPGAMTPGTAAAAEAANAAGALVAAEAAGEPSEPLRSVEAVFRLLATKLDLSPTHTRFLEAARAELTAAEAQRNARIERLRTAARERSRALQQHDHVLAVVSHDLRNPLSVLMMACSLLDDDIPEDTRRKQATVIRRSTEQMRRLVDDLLEAARIDGMGLSVLPTRCTPPDLLDAAIQATTPLAEAAGVTLVSDGAPETPVHADRDRILQVLTNLISNALDHTPEGGRVTLSARHQGDHVTFTVSDTGTGIVPEHLPHIFDRYWQAAQSRHAGAGLGLSIAKGIIDAHHGRIHAESSPGAGATFRFTLPVARGN